METCRLVLKYVLLSVQLLFFRLLCRLTVVAVLSFGLMLHRHISEKLQIVQRKAAGVVLHSAFPTGVSWLKVDAELQVSLQMFRKTESRDSWRKNSFSRDFVTIS